MNLFLCKSNVDNCLIVKCTEWQCDDWISTIVSVVLFFFSIAIIFWLKPKMVINSLEITEEKSIDQTKQDKCLKIKVKNLGKFNVNNLRIECAVIDSDSSYHLKPDFEDFLIIPSRYKWFFILPIPTLKDNSRTFKFFEVTEGTKRYVGNESFENTLKKGKIRVRIHGQHSFSGFGQSFEHIF